MHHTAEPQQADVYLTSQDDRSDKRRGQSDTGFVGVLSTYGLGDAHESQVEAGTAPFDVLFDASQILANLGDAVSVDVLIVPRAGGAAPQVDEVQLEPFPR